MLLQFHVCLLLIGVLTLDLLSKLELFIERLVFALDDVHLEDGAARVLLSADDIDLAAVVLELGDDVDQHLLKALELPTERHGLLALQAKDCIAAGSLANRAVTGNLAELALRVLHHCIDATRVDTHRDRIALHGVVLARDELSLSARSACLRTSQDWIGWVLAVLAHVLRDVGDDGLALVTGTWHKDVFAGVQVLRWNLNGLIRQDRLHSRLLKVLVRAVLRAIELRLLVCHKTRKQIIRKLSLVTEDKPILLWFGNLKTYGSCAGKHHSQACEQMPLLSRYRMTVGKVLH